MKGNSRVMPAHHCNGATSGIRIARLPLEVQPSHKKE
jgi:hypothetical protein